MNLLLRKPSTACWAPSPVGSLLSCTSCILSIWLGSGRRLQRVASNWNVWTLYQVNFKSYPAHQYIYIHHINIPYRWYFLLHLFPIFSHLLSSLLAGEKQEGQTPKGRTWSWALELLDGLRDSGADVATYSSAVGAAIEVGIHEFVIHPFASGEGKDWVMGPHGYDMVLY